MIRSTKPIPLVRLMLVGLSGDSILLADLDGTEFAISKKDAVSVKLYDCEDYDDLTADTED